MIIWNNSVKEQTIRIQGQEMAKLVAANFAVIGTNDQIEGVVKTLINSKTSLAKGYHAFCKILSKSPLNYVLWLGPTSIEPELNWWKESQPDLSKVING